MKITDIRIKLSDDPDDRLKAFCSMTFDSEFVVRDMKIIEGHKGPFVAMPSRKLCEKCVKCRYKNEIRARYCSNCGAQQPERPHDEGGGRSRLFADIAHPINADCRERIQRAVLAAFSEECDRARQPDYRSRYDDYDVEFPEQPATEVQSTGHTSVVDKPQEKSAVAADSVQRELRYESPHRETGGTPHRPRTDESSDVDFSDVDEIDTRR